MMKWGRRRTAVFLGVRLFREARTRNRRFIFMHVNDFGRMCKSIVSMRDCWRNRAPEEHGEKDKK